MEKFADLTMRLEDASPFAGHQAATLEASTGGDDFLKLVFHVGQIPSWSMHHQAKKEGGKTMQQLTFYRPKEGTIMGDFEGRVA